MSCLILNLPAIWRGSEMSGKTTFVPPRDRPEIAVDHRPRRLVVDVARDDEHGVVRAVEVAEELLRVVDGRSFEVGELAVEIMGVVPVLVGELRHVEPRPPAIGLVDDVDLDLVGDDALLVGEHLLVDDRPRHAVGLEPQHLLERVRGYDLIVIGEVEPGRSVHRPAGIGDRADEGAFRGVLRPLEQQMLEQMRKAGAVARLDPEADPVIDPDRRRRHRRVAGQHHLEAVGQGIILAVDPETGGRGGGGGGGTGPAGIARAAGERQPESGRDHDGDSHLFPSPVLRQP